MKPGRVRGVKAGVPPCADALTGLVHSLDCSAESRERGESVDAFRVAAAAVVAASLIAWSPARAGDDPDFLAFSLGAFDVTDDETTVEGRIEYRSDLELWIFKPFAGVMAHGDAGFYGYAGVLIDIYWGRRIVTTLSFAPGLYERGDGKDLGSALEFRSQIELGYRFDDRSRLAVSFSHMSNASIDDRNPGTESLMLTYAIPFDRLF